MTIRHDGDALRRLAAAVAVLAAAACSSTSKTEIRYDGSSSEYVVAPDPVEGTSAADSAEPGAANVAVVEASSPRCTAQALLTPPR